MRSILEDRTGFKNSNAGYSGRSEEEGNEVVGEKDTVDNGEGK